MKLGLSFRKYGYREVIRGSFLLRFHNEDLAERGLQMARGYFLQGQFSFTSSDCCSWSPIMHSEFPGCKCISMDEEVIQGLSGNRCTAQNSNKAVIPKSVNHFLASFK